MIIKCPRCGGQIVGSKDDPSCLQCGYVLYITEQPLKAPAPKAITKIDSSGRKYYGAGPGRKRTGFSYNCSKCGKLCYARGSHILRGRRTGMCQGCFRKYLLPKYYKLKFQKREFSTGD